MLDLRNVTDSDVRAVLDRELTDVVHGSDRWRVFGAARKLIDVHSFAGTRTYPRPDHPDPAKRLPLSFLVVAVLVSLRTTLENEQLAMARVIQRFPTEGLLLQALVADLADAIRPAGMAGTKAARIIACLDRIAVLDGGLEALRDWAPADARAFLLALPGFGPKAADCVMTIGLGHASMVVDVNVFRVATSLLGCTWQDSASYGNVAQVSELKARLDAAVGDDAFNCQIIHTLLLLEGRRRRGAHRGESCFLEDYCATCQATPIASLF